MRARAFAWILFVALCAATPVAAAPPPARMKPEARAHLERGLRLYDRQRYDEAIAELRAGLAIDPQPDLLYALGQAERRRGNCKRALEYYSSALALVKDPASVAALRVQIERCRVEEPETATTTSEPSREAASRETTTREPTTREATPREATSRETATRETTTRETSPRETPPREEPRETSAPRETPAPRESAALPESDDDTTPEPTRAAPAVATSAPRPLPARWYRDGVGMTLTAVGLAGVGVGAALVGLGRARLDAADQSYQQYADARDAQTLWTAGLVTLAAGGALTLVGVVRLGVVAARRSHAEGSP